MEDEIEKARKEYFLDLEKKNTIDNTRIEDLDIDYIGISLNYQQIMLMYYAIKKNSVSYKHYLDSLISKYSLLTESGKKNRYLIILNAIKEDPNISGKTYEIVNKLYEEIKHNNIKSSTIADIINKLISKLPTNLQNIVFDKINNSSEMAYNGIKDMNIEKSLKLYNNISEDFSSITLVDAIKYSECQNFNGTFNNKKLKKMLDFAYESDKFIRINNLLYLDDFPSYLKKFPKDILKQKLITYVDNITNYLNSYNISNKRVDRKPIIRSIDVIDSIITDIAPYQYKNTNWQSILNIDDLCDILKVARNNLKDVDFVFNEELINEDRRKVMTDILLKIKEYEKKNDITLINTIGVKLFVDLDSDKENIKKMFNSLSDLKMPIAITEFECSATVDMIFNNKREEIEILRERYISDLCNIINSYKLSRLINFDSITYWCVSDRESMLLDKINEERISKHDPLLLTLYSGIYDTDMNKKYKEKDFRKLKKIEKDLKNEKGIADTLYIWIILSSLIVVVAIVCYVFMIFA